MRSAASVAVLCTTIATILGLAGMASSDLVARSPIDISADSQFSLDNGVISGNGSTESPFVIAGWSISAGHGAAIRIQGTTAQFVIRDCLFTGDASRGIGIVLGESASSTAVIEQSTFENLRAGVFAYQCTGAKIEANSFNGCWRGVDGSEADAMLIHANSFTDMREHAVFLWRCHSGVLEGNTLLTGQNAIYLDSCHRVVLRGNRIREAERGLFLWDCFDCLLTENDIRGCHLGIALVHTSAGNAVYHNALLQNDRAATCDESDNQWDNGYPAGGNFWGSDSVSDTQSGPGQDLPGSDGIVDLAQMIPFAGMDRYPLAAFPFAMGTGSE